MIKALPLIVALFLVNPPLLGAQDFRVVAVDPGQWPLLKLTAVLPAEGGPAAAYLIKLGPDSRPLAARTVAELDPREPVSVLVALDTSYTLTPAHLRAVQASLTGYSERFGAGERVAILGFNNTVHLTTEFTDNRDAFAADINRLRLGGRKTELYRCLVHGVELLGRNEGRRHLLVVSDGHDEGAGLTAEQALRSAMENEVKISVIGLAGLADDAAQKHLAALKILAEETGGTYLAAAGAEESGSGLHDILTQERAPAPGESERLFQLVFDLGSAPAPSEVVAAELNYSSDHGLWVAEFALSIPAGQTRAGAGPNLPPAGPNRLPDKSYLAMADDDPKNID